MMKRATPLLCGLALAGAFSCTAGSNTTTGSEVVLHTKVEADAERDAAFDTETGWSVTLKRAAVSVGGFYYFDGEPAFVLRTEPTLLRRFAALFSPSIAHAHPGHYIAGTATGQMLVAQTAELSTTPVDFPEGAGVTGLYRSARVVLADAEGSDIDGLDGNAAFAEGVATKGDQTVYFKLATTFAEAARSVTKGEVDGCIFDETDVRGNGTVTLSIKPHVWFNLVDFSDVDPGTAEKPTEIGADATPHIAFTLGVVQLSAYHFSFQAEK